MNAAVLSADQSFELLEGHEHIVFCVGEVRGRRFRSVAAVFPDIHNGRASFTISRKIVGAATKLRVAINMPLFRAKSAETADQRKPAAKTLVRDNRLYYRIIMKRAADIFPPDNPLRQLRQRWLSFQLKHRQEPIKNL